MTHIIVPTYKQNTTDERGTPRDEMMTSSNSTTPKNSDDRYNNKRGSQGRATSLRSIVAQHISEKERLAAERLSIRPPTL